MLVKLLKLLLFLILLSLLTAIGAFFYAKHYLQEEITVPKTIHIPKGSSLTAIRGLQKSGIDVGKLDYYLLKLVGYPQAGWIDLNTTRMQRGRFLYAITHAKAALRPVTLIPGETTTIILQQLARQMELNATKLHNAYSRHSTIPEGVLVAESYRIPKGMDEEALITYLLDYAHKEHRKIAKTELGHYDEKEWFGKYITIASIVQKESVDSAEMPIVSAVIYNRLKKKMKLQMDGTLNYGRYSHQKVTPQRIREDNSSYNTYKIAALPPAPVCIVSKEAIRAAIHPADVDYLYFVRGKDGRHHFSKSYRAHRRAIKASSGTK